MRLKSRQKFIQQGHPGQRQQHGKPCLQHMPSTVQAHPDASRSSSTRVSPFASSKAPEKKTVTASVEQIISVPRKWREHHEKRGEGKRGFLVFRCPHRQRRRTRETDSWNPPTRGPTRVGADPTNSSLRPSQLTRRMTGDWMSHPHLDPGPSFLQLSCNPARSPRMQSLSKSRRVILGKAGR
jgi:hypothetical protein